MEQAAATLSEMESIIETNVINELRKCFEDDGLTACIDLSFIDFDFDLFEVVEKFVPDNNDDAFDEMLGLAEAIAKNQFDFTMDKITTAFMILDGALNIIGK